MIFARSPRDSQSEHPRCAADGTAVIDEPTHRRGPLRPLSEENLANELVYWRKRLANMPPGVELLPDHTRSHTSAGAYYETALPKAVTGSLRLLSENKAVPVFHILLAAFDVLLFRHTGQDDIVHGVSVGGHVAPRSTKSSAASLKCGVMRIGLCEDLTFNEVLSHVTDLLNNDLEYSSEPLEYYIQHIEPQRDLIRNPVFRLLISVVSPGENFETAAPPLDFHLRVTDEPEQIRLLFDYDSELFESATVRRLAGHLQTLLEKVVENASNSISRVSLLTAAERNQLLFEWNQTSSPYPRELCCHQFFEEQVRRTPDHTAVIFDNQEVSYRELNNRANQIARALKKRGVEPNDLVGICADRCTDMLAALLGIMKSGAAYVPLDSQYPGDRLLLMLEDSRLRVLVTQTTLASKFSTFRGDILCLDGTELAQEPTGDVPAPVAAENTAYVIYTSGSTGKPKGVQISHRALVNFLCSMKDRPGLTSKDTLLAVTTISFDIAALELYLPLIAGARVLMADRETASDGHKLNALLLAKRPTIMQATPATWRLLFEAGWSGSSELKILCGGEAIQHDLAAELLKRVKSFWNMYGPTETTVWSTVSEITPETHPITIGRPIANTDVYVLDRHLQPVPIGVAGDLYIGGDGVAQGYLGRPELTAQRFIDHPFRAPAPGLKIYNTGDLARYRADGELECLGRTDNQIKLRGFRIELGEIEAAISAYPGVKQNVVVAREDTPGDKRLVAYAVPEHGASVNLDSLRDSIRQKLPEYMVPSRVVILERLPLTPNGKVDRKSLPEPGELKVEDRHTHQRGPGGGLEFRLLKIWQSVLGVRRIGVNENFFELGGHSLLVPKLLHAIEQELGKRLSVAAIFTAPTIEQQALAICDGNAPAWPSAVLPIQPSGSKPPFFCFGYAAGPVFFPLARRLGYDQPLMGVDPLLLDPALLSEPYSMGEVAARLAKQICDLQPNGRYYLGGFCGGGLVAYATAVELVRQGQDIGLLALFEPHTSYNNWHSHHGARNLSRMRALRFHFDNLRTMDFKLGATYVRHRIRVHRMFLNGLVAKAKNRLRPRHKGDKELDIREMLTIADHSYTAPRFDGPVALFHAKYREPGGEWESQYWLELAPKMVRYEVPGYSNWPPHFFLEPCAGVLAGHLKTYLSHDRD